MKTLVFGGSGFLGSHVADILSDNGHEVTIFDKKESKYIREDQKIIKGDILNSSDIEKVLKEKYDYIYNFAGLADLNHSIDNPKQTFEMNVLGNINILDAIKDNPPKRFIYASTVYVYSENGSFYGISKKASEKVLEEYSKNYNIDFTIIRYGSVYGSRSDDSNRIYRLVHEALKDQKITFKGDGSEVREYINVRDAAQLSFEILSDKYKNQNLILTGLERHTYRELLDMIGEIFNNKVKITFENVKYQGHYKVTPYSYNPTVGKKIVANPYTDFGQGLLELIQEVEKRMNEGNS